MATLAFEYAIWKSIATLAFEYAIWISIATLSIRVAAPDTQFNSNPMTYCLLECTNDENHYTHRDSQRAKFRS